MIPETISMHVGGMHSKKTTKDNVSAHRLAVLALIKEFCIVKNKCRNGSSPNVEGVEVWEQTNQQKRDFSICTMKLIQNPDTEVNLLKTSVELILHPKTYKQFLNGLQELRMNGVASIMDFVQSLEVLLVEPQHKTAVVHKSSVLGLFIRRMLLAFDKLSFSNVVKLHAKYCEYYDKSLEVDEMKDECALEKDFPEENCEKDTNQILASQKQAEFFVSQQATLFQINEQAALPPAELQKKIQELIKGNPDFAEAHYLSYLNCLRAKEYLGALKNLHHYFDRSTTISQDSKPTIVSEDTNRSFRYAALNLAILHAKFGHKDEALSALKESITMAQEANDNVCLQHSLSWLYQLTPENRDTLIERSISKSGDLTLWYLSSVGIQALAQSKAISGAKPVQVFEKIMKSDILNCHHSITELLGTAFSQRAALWYLYGNSSMGDLSSQMLLFLNTSDPSKGRVYHIGEGTCLALRNLAWNSSQKGHYEAATAILILAQSLFAPHHDNASIWLQCEQIILFERALHHGRWQDAEKAVSGISVYDTTEGKLRRAELYLHISNNASALQIIKELLQDCRKEHGPNTHFYVRVLLLQAKLYLQCVQTAQALSPLTLALSLCNDCNLLHQAVVVQLHLAAIQYLIDMPFQALHLLDSIYITILAHGTTYEIACLQLLYAKCLIAKSKEELPDVRQKAIEHSLGLLRKSEILFKTIESYNRTKDVVYWQAILHHEINDTEQRNHFAVLYGGLCEQTKSFDNNTVMVP